MKYTRLTSEQFQELHEEFAIFLAVQGLDKPAWDVLKSENSEKVESLLDQFSDVVWQQTLEKAVYLEHISEKHLFMFKADDACIHLIHLRIDAPEVSLLTTEGWQWLQNEWASSAVHFRKGSKSWTNSREEALFELIQQGAVLSDGARYTTFEPLIS